MKKINLCVGSVYKTLATAQRSNTKGWRLWSYGVTPANSPCIAWRITDRYSASGLQCCLTHINKQINFTSHWINTILTGLYKYSFNIKHGSKSFYAYVRSKQKVQNKVGALEGSDGNLITERLSNMPHQRLLLKLKAHGIGNGMVNSIEKWLIDRRKRVVVDGEV